MSTPTSIEAELLDQCGELLKFAAENKTGLPVQVVTDIEEAWDAQSKSNWNPQIATKFWTAYDGLCSHLRPVTLDTLSASRPVDSCLSRFGYKAKTSFSRRWAYLFLVLLVVILVISMFLAYVTTTGEILTHDIQDLMTQGDKAVSDIRQQISERPNGIQDTTDLDGAALTPDARLWVVHLRQRLIDLWTIADTLYDKTNVSVSKLLSLGEYPLCVEGKFPSTTNHCYYKGEIRQPKTLQNVLDNTQDFYNFFETQRTVRARTNKAITRLAGIKAYILPALLGMLGACTYVVRTISDQIKDFTFSRTSPVRHMLRVALGSIVGVVVVTFYGTPTATQLSASAWAFVAGYAMEAVFAMFDHGSWGHSPWRVSLDEFHQPRMR
jgi:hypothetical protein